MSIKVVSIEDDGVASVACAGDMNALEMTGSGGGLDQSLGEDWAGRKVALDMSAVSYMDSAAIGWLLSLHKALGDGGGRLVVFGFHPNVKRVIDIMRLDRVLDLAEDHGHAMQRLRGAD